MSRIRLPSPRAAMGALVAACVTGALLLAQPMAAQAADGKPSPVVAGYSGEQLANARAIVAVAAARHLPAAAAVLGVAAAMGESGLRNLPYGDNAINPDGTVADSVGLFQQQHWWGTLAQRMDPTHAAGSFFTHLVRVHGWAAMTPTAAIHAVQGNADPGFYTRFVPAAISVAKYVVEHPELRPSASATAKATAKAAAKAADGSGGKKDEAASEAASAADIAATYPSAELFAALDVTWAAEWDLGDADDTISSTFTDGLDTAGATLDQAADDGADGAAPLP